MPAGRPMRASLVPLTKTPASLSCGRFLRHGSGCALEGIVWAQLWSGADSLPQDGIRLGRAHRAAARAGLPLRPCPAAGQGGAAVAVSLCPMPGLADNSSAISRSLFRKAVAARQSGQGAVPSVPPVPSAGCCGRASVCFPVCTRRPSRTAGRALIGLSRCPDRANGA